MRIAILAPSNVQRLDLFGPMEILLEAARMSRRSKLYEVQVIGTAPGPICDSRGLTSCRPGRSRIRSTVSTRCSSPTARSPRSTMLPRHGLPLMQDAHAGAVRSAPVRSCSLRPAFSTAVVPQLIGPLHEVSGNAASPQSPFHRRPGSLLSLLSKRLSNSSVCFNRALTSSSTCFVVTAEGAGSVGW